MVKLVDIYNMALSVFLEPPVTAEEVRHPSGHNVKVLSTFYQPAVMKARDEYCWSWLEDVIELSEGEPMAGYGYSYILPDSVKLIEILPSDTEYRRIGNRILSQKPIEVCIGVYNDEITPTNENIPDEFWMLVAYAMAYLASESMSNNNQVTIQVIASKYNSYLEQMKAMDAVTSSRRYINADESYIQ